MDPPSSGNSYDPVPGTAAGVLAKWNPITFGQRRAAVEYQQQLYERQLAEVENEVLRVQFEVVYRYLDITSTNQLINVHKKNIERNTYNLNQVRSLIRSGIRPGVDSLKFAGELSKAKIMLFDLQNLERTQRHELAELLVESELPQLPVDSGFTNSLPKLPFRESTTLHPLQRTAEIGSSDERTKLGRIQKSWVPRLEFWGTAYGRGSGIDFEGQINKGEGLALSRYNFGIGLQVVFPLLDWSNLNVRTKKQEQQLLYSVNATEQIKGDILRQQRVSLDNVTAFLNIATEAPVELQANEAAYRAISIRYRTGLVDYAELIRSQYDLVQAESRLRNSYIDCWKALLKLSVSRGDIGLFLEQVQ